MRKLRWLWLAFVLLVVFGLLRLRFDVDVLGLLPESIPEVRGLAIHQELFEGSNDLIISLKHQDPAVLSVSAESLAQFLQEQDALAGAVRWQPPWQEHPEQAAELTAAMWFNQPLQNVAELADRLSPQRLSVHLEELQERLAFSFSPEELTRLSYDPLGLLNIPGVKATEVADFAGDGAPFRSPDGTYRVVFVEPPHALTDYRDAIAWSTAVQNQVHAWRSAEAAEVIIQFTGGPTFHSEISSGMERDMTRSMVGTALVVSVLFFLVHRRIKPLLWLLALLALVLATTIGLCGLMLGSLNVVSLGFAAILLGLAVDYGLVLYQERQAHPKLDLNSARALVAPGILWSACTTAFAFGLLNFGGLNGLAELGTLVACGVLIAACFVLLFYLPPLEGRDVAGTTIPSRDLSQMVGSSSRGQPFVWVATLVVLTIGCVVMLQNPPRVDSSSKPLRPARSPAYDAMDEFEARITSDEFRWILVVTGETEQEVADELTSMRYQLDRLESRGLVSRYALPDLVWANPKHQRENHATIRSLLDQRERIFGQVESAGFTEESLKMANAVFAGWENAIQSPGTYWPDNEVSHWIIGRTASHAAGRLTAVGQIEPASYQHGLPWEGELVSDDVLLVGWDRLGPALMAEVQGRLQWVMGFIGVAVLLVLYLTFRTVREVVLSVAVLGVGGALLSTVMSVLDWEWNLMNLMAIPLLIGTTVDYTIHTQLSLRRNSGEFRRMFNSTGKALLLCAMTTSVGFGSLAFSNNSGLSSLGSVCAVGTICFMIVACFLLPGWWNSLAYSSLESPPRTPSRLYGPSMWVLAGRVVRFVPHSLARRLGAFLASAYGFFATKRKAIVVENLLPVLDGNRPSANAAARRLFANFGTKIADLLHFEQGGDVDSMLVVPDLDVSESLSLKEGLGTLLVTPHLGNWEYGAPALKSRGIDLLVITNPEPGEGFTEERRRARDRWGIETIVIGDGAFAFVDVLKRLQQGAVVALLIDRPRPESAVDVEFLGCPFRASNAAAELARASGCQIIPTAIPLEKGKYTLITLPPVKYDRATLNTRETRRTFTQEIVRAFEPLVRQYPDQWFHFVPIWPESRPR